ncbi:MAG: DUF1415 domain-containing protein [Hylemonella sp.]|nr:DUF1415 domain-containing protein [Hylemonella sp.]MDP1937311.1 DUF1415 domain-containing protein [Hylemonella sp.]
MTTFSEQALVARVVQDMRAWLERAVIGLNLCPFAKSVHVKGQVHYVVSLATEPRALREELVRELTALHATDPELRDTTLLMAPLCLQDFLDFNDFLGEADAALNELGLEGDLQIASFHPQFQFAGTSPDDITNYTNRAPYPTLHLLREASIDRAVQVFPEAEMIFEKNMQTLEQLGHAGWAALKVGAGQPESEASPTPGADKEKDASS